MYDSYKSDNKPMILLFIFLIAIAGGFIFIKVKNSSKKESKKITDNSKEINRTVKYYNGNMIYEIKQQNNRFTIVVQEQVQCIQAPCDPIKVDQFDISLVESINKLKEIFDYVFSDSSKTEISISDTDLKVEDLNILKNILFNKGNTAKLTYKVLGEDQNSKFMQKGYAVTKGNDSTIITVALGKRKTGGYSIKVTNVDIEGDNVTIYVEEKQPYPGDTVTQAITYPSVNIEFNKTPVNITVYGPNNDKYPLITNVDEEPPVEEEPTKEPLRYQIVENPDNLQYEERGFYVTNFRTKTLVTVSAGQKPSSGYGIEIVNVEIKDDRVTIIVKETTPKEGTSNATVITYPKAQVEFNRLPDNIKVRNEDGKTLYKKITSDPKKVGEEEDKGELKYQIVGSSIDHSNKYKERGYYVSANNDGIVTLTISDGQKNSGGTSIQITWVLIEGNNATVYYLIKRPGSGGAVTQEINTPIASVEFNREPENIKVINDETTDHLGPAATK